MKKILFQGDSVTDSERSRNYDGNVGYGYALLVKARLGLDYPNEYEFLNRGIGGNRIIDLYARIKEDIINLRPDYMSILIGVNDVGHEFSGNNGVDAQKYEKIYSMMIEEIKAELPDIRIMIMEPFCLKGRATENTEERPDKWNEFNTELRIRAAKARAIAEKYGLPFIPLQQKLDDCSLKTGATYLLGDGVHPTAMGHELIAREWIKAFNEIK